ncbi:MAG: glucose-1-phosphate cytidylyltransferase [Bradymonadia bacterium]|jgi:glucose-1-phosphate cytidylyltransferase
MKAIILAGGFGTRLAEMTEVRPKPMVEIGGRPILWHIMKHFSQFDVQEFVIALGYRGDDIKRYFLEYPALTSDLTVHMKTGAVQNHDRRTEPWTVNLVDTGVATLTGGRVSRLQRWVGNETFIVTYGDGVANIDIDALLKHHREQGKIATVTAVRPPARFGGLEIDSGAVSRFVEKPQAGEGWINGGFLVFEPEIFDILDGDQTSLESDALERLAADGQLAAYQHEGFWQCMDTLRDRNLLERLWASGEAPWCTWPTGPTNISQFPRRARVA